MALSVFVIANDFTALTVALPNIEAEFDSDVGTVQWVINAYALVFGVLIVSGGRLADLFGRKRLFFIGAAVFAAFSLLAGAAQDVTWLIVCRAIMGAGGAIIWPATLGLTYSILSGRAGLAGGLIIGAAGLGNAAGPLLGGVLTDSLSWRWVLFINLPIAAIASLAVWRNVPSFAGPHERIVTQVRLAPTHDNLTVGRDARGTTVEDPPWQIAQADHAALAGPFKGLPTRRCFAVSHDYRTVGRDSKGTTSEGSPR
jgi:MFS family permease